MFNLVPVAFMILIGMSKEAYLEYQRWKDDKRLNQKPCKILTDVNFGDLVFEDSELQYLKVGDIIKIVDD